MKAMIFAAGLGTRLKPLTDTMPKALVPLAGKSLLAWQVEKLRDAGIRDIIVNVHHFPDMIIDAIRRNDAWGCNIMISEERDELLDTGGGLKKAVSGERLVVSGEPILACNVDILSNIDIRALVTEYERTGISQLVVSERETQRYLCFNEEGNLCGWTNKKTGEAKPENIKYQISNFKLLAFSGMQILGPEVLARLKELQESKFSLISFYLDAMKAVPLKAYIPEGYMMMDVGKIEQIDSAEHFAEQIMCTKKEKK